MGHAFGMLLSCGGVALLCGISLLSFYRNLFLQIWIDNQQKNIQRDAYIYELAEINNEVFSPINNLKKSRLILFICFSLNSFCYSQSFKLHIKIALLPQLEEVLSKEGVQINLYHNGDPFAIQSFILFNSRDTLIEYYKDTLRKSLSSDTIMISLTSNILKPSLDKEFFLGLYDIILKKDTTIRIAVEFPENCPYNRNAFTSICHKCKKSDKVIPIIYSLRDPIFDENGNIPGYVYPKKYLQGQNWVSPECRPTWYCRRDKFRF